MIYKGKNVIQWEEKKVSSTNDAHETCYLYEGVEHSAYSTLLVQH